MRSPSLFDPDEFEFTEGLRLLDVFGVGPFLVWFGTKDRGTPELLRDLLVACGVMTSIFNGVMYVTALQMKASGVPREELNDFGKNIPLGWGTILFWVPLTFYSAYRSNLSAGARITMGALSVGTAIYNGRNLRRRLRSVSP